MSAALSQMGLVYLAEHRFEESAAAFREALAIGEAKGLLVPQTDARIGLGMIEAELGHRERALQLLLPAYRFYSRAGVKMKIVRQTEELTARLQREQRESRE